MIGEIRWRAVIKLLGGVAAVDISNALMISKSLVYRIRRIWYTYGCVFGPNKRITGRQRTLTMDMMNVGS
jgi:hypothetical protein